MEAFNQRVSYQLSPRAQQVFQSLSRHTVHESSAFLAEKIAVLSNLFTRERAGVSARYLDDPALGAGYAAYFLPVNFAKIQILLSEMPNDWADRSAISVLDIGAGPGTASLAVLDWLSGRPRVNPTVLNVTALDHSKSALMEATRLWNNYGPGTLVGPAKLTTSVEQIETIGRQDLSHITRKKAPYDLIIIANCLNELFQDSADHDAQRATLLERVLSVLKQDGTLMVVEPALRSTARALHRVRDRLLTQELCTVYSPCLHEKPCPALIKVDDWCHEERAWDPPEWISAFDRDVGLIKDALKFSYVLFRKDGRVIMPRSPNVYRVVSELRIFKGEKRAWVCNEQGRSEVGRQDRLATNSNGAFDAWHRGAIVQIDQIVRKEREGKLSELGRIPEDGVVQILRGV